MLSSWSTGLTTVLRSKEASSPCITQPKIFITKPRLTRACRFQWEQINHSRQHKQAAHAHSGLPDQVQCLCERHRQLSLQPSLSKRQLRRHREEGSPAQIIKLSNLWREQQTLLNLCLVWAMCHPAEQTNILMHSSFSYCILTYCVYFIQACRLLWYYCFVTLRQICNHIL